jgi:hypothetical protein
MEGLKVRAAGVALVSVALAGLSASSALAAPGVTVGSLSSLAAGAKAGTLHGAVVNRTGHAVDARVTVRIQSGAAAKFVGHTAVRVAANASASYRVAVKLPGSLSRGNYYLAACTPSGTGAGELGCATTQKDIRIKGGTAVRGSAVRLPKASTGATTAQAETCSSGGHTLAPTGDRVYPDIGNTGYASVHSDVYINYDAITNLFLPGTHVDLQQRSTQCLNDFSLDFDQKNGVTSTTVPGPDMTVGSITVNGQPATFTFVQPTYPGDPNGQNDADPLAHRTGLTTPINAANPNPPACPPTSSSAAQQNLPCGATKLVITPSAPIPSGTDFTVTVNYTGRPGVRPSPTGTEGWFRNATVGGEGAMVTSEPTGTEGWMPLNNHPSVKPTYDIYDTVTKGKLAIGPGRLVSSGDNPPDANFPDGSTGYHWKSSEPIANYLVENSVGNFDYSFRTGANDVVYFEAQDSAIDPARKVLNKVAMDQQEDLTHFEEQFSGPFPFNSDGIVVALPRASFEEEMQTKIVFVGGTIGGSNGLSTSTFAHENMHQWWGDNVAEGAPKLMWFKEGQATTAEYFYAARTAANAAGGQGTPAGDAAFEASLVSRFNTNYNSTSTSFWNTAPANPTSVTMNGNSNAYVRPGTAYLALRLILGPANYNALLHHMQDVYRGGSITEAQLKTEFQKALPNQSPACHNKLDAFFTQWWDTPYTGSPAAGNKPSITGPGLAGGGFYDASGGCAPYGVDVVGPPVGGDVPATLSLTVGAPAAFGNFVPGLAKDYTATTTANVISTAGDGALSVTDPSSTAPGHLVNGAFSLPTALKASAASPAGASTGGAPVSGSPLTLLTYSGPVSNDPVAISFIQSIGSSDALRTGGYSKTLTYTLSTTTP